MNLTVRYVSVACMLLAFAGCQNERGNGVPQVATVNVNVDFAQGTELPFEQLYDTIRYVPLETTHANVLGDFADIFLFDSLWAVIDMPVGLERRISLFSPEGAFLAWIGNTGEGPGQFLKVESLWYDDQARRLEVLAVLARKLLYFDLNGQWYGERVLPASFTWFAKTKDGQYWFYAGNQPLQMQSPWGERCRADTAVVFQNNLFFVDPASCTIGSYVPIRRSLMGEHMSFRCFSRPTLDEYVYFHQWFDPVVYLLDADGAVRPAFELDFGTHQFGPEDEARFARMSDPLERMRFINQTGQEKVYRLLDAGATKKEWWVAFWCAGKGWWLAIDKYTGKSRLFHSPPSFTPNSFDLVPLPTTPFGMWKGWHLWLIPAYRLQEVLAVADQAMPSASRRVQQRYERVRQVLASVGRDDNPVLVLARLRQ